MVPVALTETAKRVWEAAKKGDETAKKLVEEIDSGKTTVHAAYKAVVKRERKTGAQAGGGSSGAADRCHL